MTNLQSLKITPRDLEWFWDKRWQRTQKIDHISDRKWLDDVIGFHCKLSKIYMIMLKPYKRYYIETNNSPWVQLQEYLFVVFYSNKTKTQKCIMIWLKSLELEHDGQIISNISILMPTRSKIGENIVFVLSVILSFCPPLWNLK